MSILNWQVNALSNFVSFFIFMTQISSVNFKLIYFQLWTKEPNQSPKFETFKFSGKNLSNISCYFPNYTSLCFQILHHSLVSRKIAPLYFLKQPIKVQIFESFECLGENSSSSSYPFWNYESIPLQIFLHSSVSFHRTHVISRKFLAHAFSIVDKRIPWKYQFWHFQVLWWKFAKFLMS